MSFHLLLTEESVLLLERCYFLLHASQQIRPSTQFLETEGKAVFLGKFINLSKLLGTSKVISVFVIELCVNSS